MRVTIASPHEKIAERELDPDTFCAQCIYNVPQGTFLMLIPGMMLVVTGIILFITDSDPWRDGMIKADVIFIVLGAVMLGGGITYCSLNWCSLRKRKPVGLVAAQWTPHANASEVQLVGFSRTLVDHECLPHQPQGELPPNVNQCETQT